jgi:hypothetical protein
MAGATVVERKGARHFLNDTRVLLRQFSEEVNSSVGLKRSSLCWYDSGWFWKRAISVVKVLTEMCGSNVVETGSGAVLTCNSSCEECETAFRRAVGEMIRKEQELPQVSAVVEVEARKSSRRNQHSSSGGVWRPSCEIR